MDDWMDGGWNCVKTIYDLKLIEVSRDQLVSVDFVKCEFISYAKTGT